MEELNNILKKTKEASKIINILSTDFKNQAIINIAEALLLNKKEIIEANEIDIKNAKMNGLTDAMINRLEINESKIISISNDMKKIAQLKDPVGEIIESYKHNNGIVINKVRVPFGVICAIYESRPNVSVDIACLSLKTGNACVLRGGKEAINTNKILVKTMKNAIKDIVDDNVITLIENTDRTLVLELIQCKEYIDLVVPRGGKKLIDHVVNNAKVPFIETGAGNCHIYVDEEVDYNMALQVITNAKVSRPSVCNAIETILVNENIKEEILPLIQKELGKYCVEIRGCEETKKVISVNEATEEDFYKEYNDYIVAIKVVKDLEEAINHINKYGTKHSDCILTNNMENAEEFLNKIDSACVYVNASTRFSDGGEFGFGAELGISTQKLHARGPMGLREMTTYKYKIYGEGQVR
mgnify:CR=1 FL=1